MAEVSQKSRKSQGNGSERSGRFKREQLDDEHANGADGGFHASDASREVPGMPEPSAAV